jgi:hypothetical protein
MRQSSRLDAALSDQLEDGKICDAQEFTNLLPEMDEL